jgi:hypothetical protein
LLRAFATLTALAFVVLFIRAGSTEQHFAWTINPPATASFLGAAYASGCVLVLLALRSGRWADIRIPYLTIVAFAALSLLATVLHLDRFHFGVGGLPRFAAWLWLAVYIVVPVWMAIMLVRQERRPPPADQPVGGGSDILISAVPVPRPLAVALLAQGAVLLTVGLALYLVPGVERVLWPWALTPLTARAVASWLIAFGLGALLAGRAHDLARLEISAWSYGLMAVLELVALARHADVVRWSQPAAWGYLGLLLGILATSAAGVWLLRDRARTPSAR